MSIILKKNTTKIRVILKAVLYTLLWLLPLLHTAQQNTITLKKAINLAQKKSPDYKINVNRNQRDYWRYKNYKAGFLPELRLNATLPDYSNAIRRITNDAGQDIFVNQNQLVVEGGLSLAQSIPLTGGTLSVNTNLERIELFGLDDNVGFSVIPFTIRYSQNSLLYNPFRWDKKIEPLVYEESKREFIESMEAIAVNTSRLYFQLLKAQKQLDISKINRSNQDTLYQIAKGRYKSGQIAENDALQIELTLLNSKNNVTTNTIELKRTSQNLARYLELDTENITLDIPEALPPFEVTFEKALEEAEQNRKAVIAFRRRRLEAEKEVAQQRGNNRVNVGIEANFGISNNGNDFNTLFDSFNQQQNVSLRLGIPIFDWGVTKSRRKIAEANLDLTNNMIHQDQQAFEQEIFLHVLNWTNQREFLQTAQKAKIVAQKRYDISQKRYKLGKITITDLNIALQEKDRAILQYLNALERFWMDYYTLRQLTLYDFLEDKKINIDALTFN